MAEEAIRRRHEIISRFLYDNPDPNPA